MHPAARAPLGQFRVARLGLLQESSTVAERDDRIHDRVQPLDLVERRPHHLDAGHLFGVDRLRERAGIHRNDVAGGLNGIAHARTSAPLITLQRPVKQVGAAITKLSSAEPR